MKKKNLFILFMTLVALAGIVFLFIRSQATGDSSSPRAHLEVIGLNEENIDSVEIRESRGASKINNLTHSYSFSTPSSGKVETLRDSLKLYYPEPNNCIIISYIYTDEAPDIKTEEIRTNSGRINTIVEESNSISLNNYRGNILRRYVDRQIVEEGIYIERNNKTYSLSSSYGQAKSDNLHINIDYDTCHPLFENIVESFTINE